MRKILIIIAFPLLLMVSSCETLSDTTGISDAEVIQGLKEALQVGTDSSTFKLSASNGYYLDKFVKIPLPNEALDIKNKIDAIISLAPSLGTYLNLDAQFEDVVKSINRAAENAAKDATPIFENAISSLTISEGWDILNGIVPGGSGSKAAGFDSTAATQYFALTTTIALTQLYAPKIDHALDTNLGLGFSANKAWDVLRTNYNKAVSTINGNFITSTALSLTGYTLDPLQTESIGVFATEQALNGLFYKVGLEEKKIRKNPFQYVSDIIQKVFGSVMQ